MAIRRKAQSPKLKARLGKIGVLMGGPSTEREISLKSGQAVFNALKSLGLDVIAIDIVSDNIDENLNLIKQKNIDCAFIALHGYFGEDGKIQEILDLLNIPFTSSSAKVSRVAMDKVSSRELFIKGGLKVPRYEVIYNNTNWKINDDLTLPLVIKPAAHGSSIGLSVHCLKCEVKE